jgi:hypothetical protein
MASSKKRSYDFIAVIKEENPTKKHAQYQGVEDIIKNDDVYQLQLYVNCSNVRYSTSSKPFVLNPDLLGLAVKSGSLDCVQFLHQHCWMAFNARRSDNWYRSNYLYSFSELLDTLNGQDLFSAAASNGHLPVIQYLYNSGCVMDTHMCIQAIIRGHFDCFQFACEHGDDNMITEDVVNTVIINRHLPSFKLCLLKKPQFVSVHLANTIVENKCLVFLEYIYKLYNLQYFDNSTFNIAAFSGSIECLTFLYSSFVKQNAVIPWNEHTCALAAENGHIECLKFLHTKGCAWDNDAVHEAGMNGQIECMVYAISNGCPYQPKALLGLLHLHEEVEKDVFEEDEEDMFDSSDDENEDETNSTRAKRSLTPEAIYWDIDFNDLKLRNFLFAFSTKYLLGQSEYELDLEDGEIIEIPTLLRDIIEAKRDEVETCKSYAKFDYDVCAKTISNMCVDVTNNIICNYF